MASTPPQRRPRRRKAEPPKFYPEILCHMAPLKPAEAPLEGCGCRVCEFFRR